MPTVEEFRSSLQGADAAAIVDEWLLAPGAKYVGQADIDYIQVQLAARYGIPITEVQVWITGSAKLGFSISEKRKPGVPTLPRYRIFGVSSDIDVAVVSRAIFEVVWRDLSLHSHR